jgi:hypothetical protein
MCVCECIYVCIHVLCMYVSVWESVRACYMSVWVYVCMCVYVCKHVYLHVCLWVCVHVAWVCVCMCICVCISMYILHVWACAFWCGFVCVCASVWVCISAMWGVFSYVNMFILVCENVYVMCVRAFMCVCVFCYVTLHIYLYVVTSIWKCVYSVLACSLSLPSSGYICVSVCVSVCLCVCCCMCQTPPPISPAAFKMPPQPETRVSSVLVKDISDSSQDDCPSSRIHSKLWTPWWYRPKHLSAPSPAPCYILKRLKSFQFDFMCMSVLLVCMSVCHVKAIGGVGSPAAGVGGWHVGSRNQNWVLCQSSQCS